MIKLVELPLEKSDNLLKIFAEIHNYIYANDGLSTQQTLAEFVKILFMKVWVENCQNQQFFITLEEFSEIQTGQTNVAFLARINQLFAATKLAYVDIFAESDRLELSPITLAFIVNKLQTISLVNSSNDSQGLAFQKILSHQEKDGRGQFFTPPPVIDLCVKILQPKPSETIIDPACGSGGFLIAVLIYLSQILPGVNKSAIISEKLFGIDINKNVTRLAQMKLLLVSDQKTNIICGNALANLAEIISNNNWPSSFDIVLANPPFGTIGKITNREILAQFDLGYKWIETGDNKFCQTQNLSNGQSPEILFIECCLKLLKNGGRMAIVLPNGHLENSSLEYLRYYLKQQAQLLAVINLPPQTFTPYGTGVKTSILFLQKGCSISDYPIFFSQVKKLGYQGNKNASPVYQKDQFGQVIRDENGSPILDEDFTEVINDYQMFEKNQFIKSDRSFILPFHQLQGRLDYEFYAPKNRQIVGTIADENQVYLGDICQIVKTKSQQLKHPHKLVEYVEISDINTASLEIINSSTYLVSQLPSRASYELEMGDIITAIAGNSVGTPKHATALVTEDFIGCICTNGLRVLRNFQIDAYFLLYFMRSPVFLNQMLRYRTGAAIPHVCDRDLAKIVIYLPKAEKIDQISQRVKKSFALRQAAQKELASIEELINE